MPNLSDKLARAALDHEIDLLRVAARGYTLEQVNEMIVERRT